MIFLPPLNSRASCCLRLGSCLLFLPLPFATLHAQSPATVFQSGEAQTSLLELYTSEGCSSCPPAEKWLTSLKDSPRLWKEFVPVAFHVDYWNYLGWRDPWSSSEFSDRQREYVKSWRGDSIYTPGFVLDGKEWSPWSRPKEGPRSSGAKIGVLKVTSDDQAHWLVAFTPTSPTQDRYEVHAALLANDLTSDVKAGENRGRRLNHDFVVTALISSPLRRTAGAAEGAFAIDFRRNQPGRLALAVWVTPAGSPVLLQAVGGWLSAANVK